jgi:ribosomal protein S18 acetylase RimI-like enzyme
VDENLTDRPLSTSDEAIGMIGLLPAPATDPGLMISFFVKPSHRSMGVGSALIEALINKVLVQDGRDMIVTPYEHNDGGIRLYKKFGFVRKERFKEGDGPTQIRMELKGPR